MTDEDGLPTTPGRLSGVSVFAGAGGLDLGAHRAGLEVVLANDTVAEAETSYLRLLPDTVEFKRGPVQSLLTLPEADVLLGGYPCQPFSMGGPRRPRADPRGELYLEYARCLKIVNPRYFVAENVPGLYSLAGRAFLDEHLEAFANTGEGYVITYKVLKAEEYGVPQRRRRLFMVGVRRDLEQYFHFPLPTHAAEAGDGKARFASHGDEIAGFEAWPEGEFYERPDPEGHWPWYYMSRNRKAKWDQPSYTIIANARHTPIHPASPMMRHVWSELADGYKQGWEFTDEYEHVAADPNRLTLEEPRRLSWRECAAIQTFPREFEPAGNLMRKVELIGNAVPPRLAEVVIGRLLDGSGLSAEPPAPGEGEIWTPPGTIAVPSSPPASSTGRRRIMQGVKASATKPEVALTQALSALKIKGYRKQHRVQLSRRKVTVDVAFTRIKLAVFVDGCFWHSCPKHGRRPTTNMDYWQPKLDRNVQRDREVDEELRSLGWTVLRVWEHEDAVAAARRVGEKRGKLLKE